MTSRARSRSPWTQSVSHLSGSHPRWPAIFEQFGPCPLRPRGVDERFLTLIRSIIGQQISAKAAESIAGRFLALAGSPPDPKRILALDEADLRSVGLSSVKQRYLKSLAQAALDGLNLETIHKKSDQEVIDLLTQIKGVGVWTAEMFLIFALNRPDVLPVGDLGIRVGLGLFHELEAPPTPKDCPPLAEAWRPHRTLAMWYLWRLAEARRNRV
jgi:DNA-3-methyladenine glycosylase II